MIKWICTDDDSAQYVKKLSESKFALIEMGLVDPERDVYAVYTAEIDLDDIIENSHVELLTALNSYSYSNEIDVRKEYGDSANQIMAECFFEFLGPNGANILLEDDEDKCRSFIESYTATKLKSFTAYDSGNNMEFHEVEKIPGNYVVWNIPKITGYENYVPLAIEQKDEDGFSHVQMSSLAAIELSVEDVEILRNAAACGINNLEKARKGIKSKDEYVRLRAEKALPIFEQISD